jgi:hypothetical protein
VNGQLVHPATGISGLSVLSGPDDSGRMAGCSESRKGCFVGRDNCVLHQYEQIPCPRKILNESTSGSWHIVASAANGRESSAHSSFVRANPPKWRPRPRPGRVLNKAARGDCYFCLLESLLGCRSCSRDSGRDRNCDPELFLCARRRAHLYAH